MSNPGINLTAQPDYASQLADIQRRQKLADMLQQQAAQPLQTDFGGAPAPISWASLLAKGLDTLSASGISRAASDEQKALGQSDRQSALDLAKTLTATQPTLGAPDTAATQAQLQNPTLPGSAPLTAPAPSVSIPGVQGTPAGQAPAMSDQQKLAALLTAQGGPQTQGIRDALLPQIMQHQNLDYENQLNRNNKVWENSLPMSTAAQQEVTAQGRQAQQTAQADAQFTNQLPMTAAQKAEDARQRATLGETRRYHDLMSGKGLTEEGAPNPAVANWAQNVLAGNATLQNVPAPLKTAVSNTIAQAPKAAYTPLAGQRFSLESNRITGNLMKLPQYSLTANGLPYLQRIDAALKVPGSVSDQDLLDSLTKLNTAGNAITDAQVRIVTDGKSYSDWAGTIANKFKTGGVLSDAQRQQIKQIAGNIYDNYKKGYQPVYDQAVSQLKGAGVPEAFWTIPDLNRLNQGQIAGSGTPPPGANIAPAGTKATGPNGKVLTSDGKGGWN